MKKLLLAGAMLLMGTATLLAQAPANGNKQSKPKTAAPAGSTQGNGQGGQGKGQVQGQRANWTPEQKADTVAKRMTKQLNLTADQATQVRSITLTRAQKMDEIRKAQAENPQERAKQCHAVRQKWEQDLQGILTPDQWAKYQAKKQERIQKAKQRRAQMKDADKGKTPEQIQDEIETEAEQVD